MILILIMIFWAALLQITIMSTIRIRSMKADESANFHSRIGAFSVICRPAWMPNSRNSSKLGN